MAYISVLYMVLIIFVDNLNTISSAPSFVTSTYERKEQGCVYQNKRYNESDKIETSEPCLRCRCINKNLVCRLRMCIQVPDPPPPGCYILHHHNECCPKLVCNSDMGYGSGSNSILEARSGTAEQKSIIPQKGQGCLHNGTIYAEGSAMDTSSLCEYCYCIKGEQHCVKPQCLLSLPGCEPIYMKHTCCPTKYNCSYLLTTTSEPTPTQNKGCEIRGKNYPEGEMIEGFAKQCENCYCVQGEVRCEPVICSIPAVTNQHCSPIYTAGHCCPSSYKCNLEDGDETAETRHYSSVEVPEVDDVVVGEVTERKAHHRTNQQHADQQRQITSEDKNNVTNNSSLEYSSTISSLLASTRDKSSEENFTTDITSTDVTMTSTIILINDTEPTTMLNDITTLSSIAPDDTTTVITDDNTIDNFGTTKSTDEFSTTMMTLTDATVLPTSTELNDNITSNNSSTTMTSFVGYNYTKPAGYISPDIEAIINITQSKEHSEDYEYDYNEPSLPPSLPNLRIIPFVAADAVVSKPDELVPPKIKYPQNVQYPIIHEKPVIIHTTERPIFFKVSHPNRFSPPTETEGGFIPREPIIDHPFYESKVDVQPSYHTKGYNIEITELPLISQSQTVEKRCVTGGHRYNHGELISEPTSCQICTCFYGEIICQEPKCSPLQSGCIRLHDHALGCCGRVICGPNELESPTRVVDRIDHVTPMPPVSLQQSPSHLPAFTVADLVITPDPFRDVIRTEPAPDLPSLMGDIIHLWEHSTSQSSTSTLPSITSSSPDEAQLVLNNNNNDTISSPTNLSTTLEPSNLLEKNSNRINVTNFPIKELTGMNLNVTKINLYTGSTSTQNTEEMTDNKTEKTPEFKTSSQTNLVMIGITKTPMLSTTLKPSKIEKIITQKSKITTENPSITTNTVTDNTEELKSEQKNEEDIEDNDDNFSFSSMLDLFFSGGNSESKITTNKPSPFQFTSTTIKPNTKLPKNETTESIISFTTIPIISTTSKLKNKLTANKTYLINNYNSSFNLSNNNYENNTKVSLPPYNKLDNNSNDKISQLNSTILTEELTTEKQGYLISKNTLNTTTVKTDNDNNNNNNLESTTQSNLKQNVLNQSTTLHPAGADPGAASGLLKLAGCNIYGRMYRVGRIISELSGPCLECMCTEVGVQCRPLPC